MILITQPRAGNAIYISKRELASDTFEITWEVPADFAFIAGQYVTITLPQLNAFPLKDQYRDFSLSSAPYEVPRVTTAFQLSNSTYKQTLNTLSSGSKIRIEGPKGAFVLPEDTSVPVVLVAGGIGITPFMSMLTQTVHETLACTVHLLYFNHDEKSTACLPELNMLVVRSPSLSMDVLYKRADHSILNDISRKHSGAHWYVAGPPGMVSSAKEILKELTIPDTLVYSEEFTGYG